MQFTNEAMSEGGRGAGGGEGILRSEHEMRYRHSDGMNISEMSLIPILHSQIL
jgi:hypothetical protein